jgi:hypothetical protein
MVLARVEDLAADCREAGQDGVHGSDEEVGPEPAADAAESRRQPGHRVAPEAWNIAAPSGMRTT